MRFAQPWFLLLLLALPLLAWWRARRSGRAAFTFSSLGVVGEVHGARRDWGKIVLAALRWFSLVLFIVALARPQWTEGESHISASGIDIVVAFDLSDSMAAEDDGFRFNGEQVNRLFISRQVLEEFVRKRPSDRIGLVAFSGQAYIAAPLSLDHDFLLGNLERLTLDTIKEEGTAIGAGITASINRLRDVKSKSKIIIMITDGQNTVGQISPLTAAEAAKVIGIKVYTIGVGSRGTARLPYTDVFGRRGYRAINVDIDEETLTKIADMTGGKYFRADKTDTLRQIYDEIDRLEKTEVEVKQYQHVTELFPWLLWPGLGLLLLEVILGHTIWRRLP